MDKKVLDLINQQIVLEIESALIYLDMSHWLGDNGFPGMSKWFLEHYKEEMMHAHKFMDYIASRGERVTLTDIKSGTVQYKDPIEIAKAALDHEKGVTAKIGAITKAARDTNDYATEHFNSWFVQEQVEEEATFNDLIDQLKLAKDNLYLVDQDMGSRVFKPEPASK